MDTSVTVFALGASEIQVRVPRTKEEPAVLDIDVEQTFPAAFSGLEKLGGIPNAALTKEAVVALYFERCFQRIFGSDYALLQSEP